MVSFPSYFLLIPYGLFFLVLVFFLGVNLKHLFHTGMASSISLSVTSLFIFYVAVVLFITGTMLAYVNWNEPIIILNNEWSGISELQAVF